MQKRKTFKINKKNGRMTMAVIREIEMAGEAKKHDPVVLDCGRVAYNDPANSLLEIKINGRSSEIFHAVNNNYEVGEQRIPIYGINFTTSIN